MTESRSRILTAREVTTRTGLSRTTVWRLERFGKFPPRRQLSANRVGWIEEEVNDWIATRTAIPGTRALRSRLAEGK